MKSVLITGCNRGLGLGLVKAFMNQKSPPECLIATCRKLEKAEELQEFANTNSNIHVVVLDVNDVDSFKDFASKISNIVKENGLNVLFNNAGVSPKFGRLNYVKPHQLIDTFRTNTVGPIMLSKALLPLLKLSAKNNKALPMGTSRAAIINMSSILGSIATNTDGGLYPYKCSKVALNMATSSMSLDLKDDEILVTSIHPGWVRTDMGGKNAPMEASISAEAIVKLLHQLDMKHAGAFVQWDGKTVPW